MFGVFLEKKNSSSISRRLKGARPRAAQTRTLFFRQFPKYSHIQKKKDDVPQTFMQIYDFAKTVTLKSSQLHLCTKLKDFIFAIFKLFYIHALTKCPKRIVSEEIFLH